MQRPTDPEVDALEAQIRHAMDADVDRTRGLSDTMADGREFFCEHWGNARELLTLLQNFAPSVPGIGLFVTMGLKAALALGNVFASSYCQGTTTAGGDVTRGEPLT